MTSTYPYVWRWRRVQILDTGEYRQHPFSDRVGTRCRVIARGTMNSAAIEFEADGHRAIVSRNALRKGQRMTTFASVGANPTLVSLPVVRRASGCDPRVPVPSRRQRSARSPGLRRCARHI